MYPGTGSGLLVNHIALFVRCVQYAPKCIYCFGLDRIGSSGVSKPQRDLLHEEAGSAVPCSGKSGHPEPFTDLQLQPQASHHTKYCCFTKWVRSDQIRNLYVKPGSDRWKCLNVTHLQAPRLLWDLGCSGRVAFWLCFCLSLLVCKSFMLVLSDVCITGTWWG